MTRRLISALTAVLGLIVIALAVCSATLWRPSATAVATMTSRPAQPYVLVEPGVLGLVNADVTVEAKASGKPVMLAVAYAEDAKAWLANDPYTAVTGLKTWDTLSTQAVTKRCPAKGEKAPATSSPSATASAAADSQSEPSASASATPATDAKGCTILTTSGANPAGADVWLLSASGKGKATLKVDASDPTLVLVAATDGAGPAPTLTLTWPRTVSTPWLIPGLVVGGLLLLAGVFVFLIDVQARHAAEERRRRAAERAARLATADSTMTLGIPALTDPNRPLSRRERREKERAEAAGEEWIDPRTGPIPTMTLGEGEATEAAETAETAATEPAETETPVPESETEETSDSETVSEETAGTESEDEPEVGTSAEGESETDEPAQESAEESSDDSADAEEGAEEAEEAVEDSAESSDGEPADPSQQDSDCAEQATATGQAEATEETAAPDHSGEDTDEARDGVGNETEEIPAVSDDETTQEDAR